MKISTKGRYGVRAMLDLAANYSEGLSSLGSIAERQGISEGYLEQLFSTLKKSGLVLGTRGFQGGYSLSRSPGEIRVGDILRALEGSLAPVDCVKEGTAKSCKRIEYCATRPIWEKIRDEVNNIVDSITLEMLLEEEKVIDNRLIFD